MKNALLRLRSVWNPDMYHGWGKQKRYFEGWYFKLVNPDEKFAFAVIPGVSIGKDGERHAFIQVLDGKKCKATYHEFDFEDFQPSEKEFRLQLGDNSFSSKHITVNLPELKGALSFQNQTPWPKMLGAPGIMGWYSFVPFMECNHGVLSLHHSLSGNLAVYGNPVSFSKGTGYIEKDWGLSFPRSWIWMQSNHFGSGEKVCLMASVAHIPWLGSFFPGFIVGLQIEEKLHRFATYTGAQMKASLGEKSVELSFKDKRYQLEVIGKQAPGADLVSPITGNMTGKVNESMQGKLELRFFENGKLLFEGIGRNAGMEIAGEVSELLTQEWRR